MRDFFSAWAHGTRATVYEIGLLNPNNKFHRIAINRHKELFRLPLLIAVKAKKTGEIFTDGNAHGDIRTKHNLGNKEFIRGFLNKNKFLTAEQALKFVKNETGYSTSNETLMSGEEWIPKLENRDNAEYYGTKLHEYGFNSAKIRIDIYKNKNINHNHIRLLKIMIDSYKKHKNSVWKQMV